MKGNIWVQVLERLETKLRRHDFLQWLAPTSLLTETPTALEIRVPDQITATWLTRQYTEQVLEALTEVGRGGVEVKFVVGPPVTDTKPARTTKGPQGKAVLFEAIEPWDEGVAGAELLTDLARAVERFVTLPSHASTVIALWVMHTFTHDAAFFSPILAITSPVKQCGKTTLLNVVGSLVYRPQSTNNLTAGVLIRFVDKHQPTLLIDEADSFLLGNDLLRGLLNSGHNKANPWVLRNVGDEFEPRRFCTWCPKAIALIGRLPGTLEDRSIQVRMRRQRDGEEGYRAEEVRLDRVNDWHAPLRRRAMRWTDDHLDAVRQIDPEIPSALRNRSADNWRSLFAIADVAGGEWPERARRAAEVLSGDAFSDEQEPGVELLKDLVDLLNPAPDQAEAVASLASRPDGILPSTQIIDALLALPDRPWATWRGDRPITPHALAKLLRPLGIHSAGVCQVGDKVARGYRIEAFSDAISRYLPLQVIKCCTPNVYGPKSPKVSDRESPSGSLAKVQNRPGFIGRTTLDHLDRGKRGVIPMIPALERQISGSSPRSRIHSSASSSRKGKAN